MSEPSSLMISLLSLYVLVGSGEGVMMGFSATAYTGLVGAGESEMKGRKAITAIKKWAIVYERNGVSLLNS